MIEGEKSNGLSWVNCKHPCATFGECGLLRLDKIKKEGGEGGCGLRRGIQNFSEETLGQVLSSLPEFAMGCVEIEDLKNDLERRLAFLNGHLDSENYFG